jgi:hypothetical protein
MGWNSLTPNSLLRTLHLKSKLPVLAPAPAATVLGPTAPNTTADMSAATLAAKAAALKTRKRAGAGSLLTTPPASGINPPPNTAPRTLLGY